MKRVAIIGAGIAGLTLARQLRDRARITVLEKSRGVGGRMATRYAPPFEFDHGAQFFTARTKPFRELVQRWSALGVVGVWNARLAELDRDRVLATGTWDAAHPRYVAIPGMNQLGKRLAGEVEVRLQTPVKQLERRGREWRLFSAGGDDLGSFDWVVSTAPAAQTAALLPGAFAHHGIVEGRQMLASFALLLGFERPPQLEWQAAVVHNADISWIAVNSSKPGRPRAFSLVVHSTNSFADACIDRDPEEVSAHLVSEVNAVAGIDAAEAEFRTLHRWRYANIDKQAGDSALVDVDQGLAACGDWCIRGRVEGAFTSAMALAETLGRNL